MKKLTVLWPCHPEPREPLEGVDDLGSDGQDHEQLQEGLHVGGGHQLFQLNDFASLILAFMHPDCC